MVLYRVIKGVGDFKYMISPIEVLRYICSI